MTSGRRASSPSLPRSALLAEEMNVVHSAAANAMPPAKVPSLIFPSSGDFDRRVRYHQIEQLHDIGVVHAHTTDRSRLAHLGGMRRAVDIDVAAHRVDLSEAVAARFAAREPQDAGQDPVAPRIAGMELRRPQLAGRPAPHEHRVVRLPGADLSAHDVAAARRAEAAVLLAQAVLRRRDGVGFYRNIFLVPEDELLPDGADFDLHRRAAKNRLSSAPHSAASTPPSRATWFLSTSFFGSVAPNTTLAMRAWNMAPMHISQGSSVT